MKQIKNNTWEAEEGKMFISKETKQVIGKHIQLGMINKTTPDSIERYEEVDLTDEINDDFNVITNNIEIKRQKMEEERQNKIKEFEEYKAKQKQLIEKKKQERIELREKYISEIETKHQKYNKRNQKKEEAKNILKQIMLFQMDCILGQNLNI